MSDDEALAKFRSFCESAAGKPEYGDILWFDMSIGFFAALGLPFTRSNGLAIAARYDHRYWVDAQQPSKSS